MDIGTEIVIGNNMNSKGKDRSRLEILILNLILNLYLDFGFSRVFSPTDLMQSYPQSPLYAVSHLQFPIFHEISEKIQAGRESFRKMEENRISGM